MKLFIKEAMEKAGIGVVELAELSGVSKSYISDMVSGKRTNPSLVTICKISHALGVPAVSLFSCDDGGERDGIKN